MRTSLSTVPLETHAAAHEANAAAPPLSVTLVLPGSGRSGGVRVTVEMANRLLARGHRVRIAYRSRPLLSRDGMVEKTKRAMTLLSGHVHSDWLSEFKGRKQPFARLAEDVDFPEGEIAVAVGTMVIKDVFHLPSHVVKLRYCHGFSENQDTLTREAWGLPMQSVAVSSSLLPRLEELSRSKALAVIANGINPAQYHIENFPRRGIGAIFSRHYLKAPEHTLEILRRARERWPFVPFYVFGEGPRPRELPRRSYWRLPSVEKARELYNRCKVWILASRSEGLPGPLLEAMACGCAVVSTSHAGSLEVIQDGANGFLTPVGDTNLFLEKIDALLTDEELRRKIALAGTETVQRFNWDHSVEKMEQCLRALKQAKTLA